DQLRALIDLHRERRLHVERRGRRHAGVLAAQLRRIVVGSNVLLRRGRQRKAGELPEPELAAAGVLDQDRVLGQLLDQRAVGRRLLALDGPEALEIRRLRPSRAEPETEQNAGECPAGAAVEPRSFSAPRKSHGSTAAPTGRWYRYRHERLVGAVGNAGRGALPGQLAAIG